MQTKTNTILAVRPPSKEFLDALNGALEKEGIEKFSGHGGFGTKALVIAIWLSKHDRFGETFSEALRELAIPGITH